MNNDLRNRLSILAAALLLVSVAACSPTITDEEATNPQAAGHITVRESQVLRMGNGGIGQGTLIFRGWQYTFEVENMVIAAIGRGAVELDGEVWNLEKVEDFAGTYHAVEQEFETETGLSGVWLKNENGVKARMRVVGQDISIRLDSAGSVVTLK